MLLLLSAVCLLGLASGCGRFRKPKYDTVYVAARKMYLHDRVAAVSERVAEVVNGQQLQVLERSRRFFKVKTEQNQIGWIEERAVIDASTHDAFIRLAADHKDDSAAATATLRDDLYMHVLPGRATDHFYLLAGNDKVQLLARASVPKVSSQRPVRPAPPHANVATQQPGKTPPPAHEAKPKTPLATPQSAAIPAQPETPPPVMEDWWLVRDSQGRAGWLLASRLYVDVPDEIAQYGEGQRFVGCWVLTKITDPDATTPDHQVPEYLTITAPLSSGQRFDFDQVRVFTWSVRHHRYETAFRLRSVQGYLPMQVGSQPASQNSKQGATGATVPTFSFQITGSEDVTTDPATGITRPAAPRTIRFQMIDTRVLRIGPDLAPIPIAKDHQSDKKAKDQKPAKKKHK